MGRKKTIEKEPVTIRFKKLANGNQSIYFDSYQDGKRRYEFLKLYLIPETGRNKTEARRKNAETMAVVNVIKAQRVLEIKNRKAGIITGKNKMKLLDLIDICAKRNEETTKSDNDPNKIIYALKKHITLYKGEDVQLKDVDKDFCTGFIRYLKNFDLSANTVWKYYSSFVGILRSAEQDGLISKSPDREVSTQLKPKMKESNRVYLTIDEVEALANTPCKSQMLKKAFMFSCFCGLRISDIRRLKWEDIEVQRGRDGENVYRLSLEMTKTKKRISFLLSHKAISWLPEKTENPLVFYALTNWVYVKTWVKNAGITKNVTFHTARHTFATMMLTLGADIYTTSKLLGHSNISTTEIYAKIIDKKKDEAMGLIDKFF